MRCRRAAGHRQRLGSARRQGEGDADPSIGRIDEMARTAAEAPMRCISQLRIDAGRLRGGAQPQTVTSCPSSRLSRRLAGSSVKLAVR